MMSEFDCDKGPFKLSISISLEIDGWEMSHTERYVEPDENHNGIGYLLALLMANCLAGISDNMCHKSKATFMESLPLHLDDHDFL